MSVKDKVNENFKNAMRAKDTLRLNVLRQLISAVGNEEIATGKREEGLSDEGYLKVVKREARKRQDAIGQFEKAGRVELVNQENQELEILQAYLPAQISREEVERVVGEVVIESGANSLGQFGQVMSQVMKRIGDRTDGNVVSDLVKEALSHLSE